MKGITIPAGYITVYNFPLNLQGDAYRTCSNDFNVSMFLRAPRGLERNIAEAAEDQKHYLMDGDCIFTPSVVIKRVHRELSHHSAELLAPPNLYDKPELIVPGLVVPDLRIVQKFIGGRGAIGYLMVSDYVTSRGFSQKFYVQYNDFLRELDSNPDIRYHGRVVEVPKERAKRPKVIILRDSKNESAVFRQNREKLEEIAKSKARFWWKETGNTI